MVVLDILKTFLEKVQHKTSAILQSDVIVVVGFDVLVPGIHASNDVGRVLEIRNQIINFGKLRIVAQISHVNRHLGIWIKLREMTEKKIKQTMDQI